MGALVSMGGMRAGTGDYVETDYLVMRMVPYGESGEIAGGLSPDQGRLSFMVRGARTPKRMADNPFGLFRRLRVRYKHTDRDIQNCEEVEILCDHGRLCQDYGRYVSACWLSRLCMANAVPGVSAPCFFRCLDVALERLASGEGTVACIETGVILVYLEENGWLPSWEDGSREENQCLALLKMGMGGTIPPLKDDNWVELRGWALGILCQTECVVPSSGKGRSYGKD